MTDWKTVAIRNARADGQPDPLPVFETGIPFCNTECPHHDGKRCRLLGLRPSNICEPAVSGMAEMLDDLTAPVSEPRPCTLVQVLDAFVRLCVAQAFLDACPSPSTIRLIHRRYRDCAALELCILLRDGAVA